MVQQTIQINGYYEDEIDCTSTGSVEILPLDQRFVTIQLSLELNLVSSIITPPTISVGNNSPDYDNVLGSTSLTQTTVNDMSLYDIPASLSGSSSLRVKIIEAADASEYQIKALVTGYPE